MDVEAVAKEIIKLYSLKETPKPSSDVVNNERRSSSTGTADKKSRSSLFSNCVIVVPDRIESDLRDCLRAAGAIVKKRSEVSLRKLPWEKAMADFTVLIR